MTTKTLTLQALRWQAYQSWDSLCYLKNIYSSTPSLLDVDGAAGKRFAYTNESFKAEVRQRFGDLRRKTTWIKAAVALTAHLMVQSYLEPRDIVGYMSSPTYMPDPIREHYGEAVIEEMLTFPEIGDIIRAGLENLYRQPVEPADRALADGFMQQFCGRLPALTGAQG